MVWYSCSFTASLEELLPLWCFQRRLQWCPRTLVMCAGRYIVWFLIFLEGKFFASLEYFHFVLLTGSLTFSVEGVSVSCGWRADGVNGPHHLCRILCFGSRGPSAIGVWVRLYLWINTHPSSGNHSGKCSELLGELCWAQRPWMSRKWREKETQGTEGFSWDIQQWPVLALPEIHELHTPVLAAVAANI